LFVGELRAQLCHAQNRALMSMGAWCNEEA
jgi:hypothetical protein